MALSFGIKDYIEGGVLAFVILLNVSIGFWQEYRAEKRMDALRALSSPSAMVLRDGKTQVISKYVSLTPLLLPNPSRQDMNTD
jgi:magnesium-transporting ATPase (P-type)